LTIAAAGLDRLVVTPWQTGDGPALIGQAATIDELSRYATDVGVEIPATRSLACPRATPRCRSAYDTTTRADAKLGIRRLSASTLPSRCDSTNAVTK
jgi:hypothetical protein